ncbi:alpha/beta hydrolase [Actinomycetospora sp. OC33-EN08]|uniref:Alpha/beta hydrolase n=1 Tax=Actinomycetospora aurantiaca TaxID=3129233 RepID=A0ABU8MKF3_9PSEU
MRRVVVALVSGCLLLLTACAPSGGGAAPPATDVATAVDVGGRRVWLECHGPARPGTPTVVLMSGFGNAGDIWDVVDPERTPPPEAVAPALARDTRVCAYDRPGSTRNDGSVTTRSDPAPQPRTAQDWASELDAVLTAGGVPGPYVLVAHSFGGLAARLYAAQHPDRTAGLVMVDSTTEETFALLSPEQQAVLTPPAVPGVEQIDVAASTDQVAASARERPHPATMPTWVVSAGVTEFPPDFPDLARAVEAQRTAQSNLATTTLPGSVHALADRSSHYVHVFDPDLVVRATRDVLARATGPSSGGTR